MKILTPEKARVSVFADTQAQAENLEQAISASGYACAGRFHLSDMVETTRPLPASDAIVIRCDAPNDALFGWIKEIKRVNPRPVTLFSEDDTRDTMQAAISAGVDAYMTVGIAGNRIRSSVDLAFAHHTDKTTLLEKIEDLSSTLMERKLTERAKGIIMKERGLAENEAFRFLQKTAMNRNMRMSELSRTIVEAADLLA